MMFDPQRALHEIGHLPDEEIDVAHMALALAAVNHPGISFDRYVQHLAKLSEQVAARYKLLLEKGAEDDAGARLAALKHVILDTEGYAGEEENKEALESADLMRVIDRRRGSSAALAVLFLHVGHAQGWDVAALNFPGEVLCRLEQDGQRLIFDPAAGCRLLQAPDLREKIKRYAGPKAELTAEYYETLTNRGVLIRLQNIIKSRQIEAEEYKDALRTVETMREIDPSEFRLLFDAGVLYARTGQKQLAIKTLEDYMRHAKSPADRYDASLWLDQIRNLPD